MKYTFLGNSNIKVSKLCVGGMSFGIPYEDFHMWTLDQAKTTEIIDYAFNNGINFIDTANCYAHGSSEEFIGNAIHDLKIPRDKIVIASKVYFNDGGSSEKAIFREIDASLKRLKTDYLDLYILHRFDYNTPIEETMSALNKLIEQGKIRTIGASAMYGYQLHNMQLFALNNNLKGFSTMQCHYNLLYREDEREVLPICDQYNLLATPYSPLASGHLARNTWNSESLRSKTDKTMRNKYDSKMDDDLNIINTVEAIAKSKNVEMSQIALAWHWVHRDSSPILGFSSTKRIDSAIQSLDISLSADEISMLEENYTPHKIVGALPRPIKD